MIAPDRTSSCEVVEKLWSIAPATVPAASSDPGPQATVPDSGASLSAAMLAVGLISTMRARAGAGDLGPKRPRVT